MTAARTGEERRVRAFVRGRVQGVGFRFFTQDVARAHGLRGWVRNLRDGRTVEVAAAGPPDAVDRLLTALRQGPPGAYVSEVEVRDLPESETLGADFEIRPTA